MRALVVVASKHGSTAEIGQVLAGELGAAGIETVLVEPGEHCDLAACDLVVLGGAIYANEWLPQLTQFVAEHATQLSGKPAYLFASGPYRALSEDAELPGQITAIGETIGARGMRLFGGRVDTAKLGAVERGFLRIKGAVDGDYRDMSSVRSWARQIAGEVAS